MTEIEIDGHTYQIRDFTSAINGYHVMRKVIFGPEQTLNESLNRMSDIDAEKILGLCLECVYFKDMTGKWIQLVPTGRPPSQIMFQPANNPVTWSALQAAVIHENFRAFFNTPASMQTAEPTALALVAGGQTS